MIQTLRVERAKIGFDSEKLTNFLYGHDAPKIRKALDHMVSQLQIDPNIFNEGRIQMIKRSVQQLPKTLGYLEWDNPWPMLSVLMHSQFQIPGTVHYGMFIPCLKLLASDELLSEILEDCLKLKIFGCYAQTEMGHGSDVQSLMTTATFDEKTDEIILNTPCLEAAKFWPGDLGLFANHALVFARLLVRGNDLGVHSFLLKIRGDDMKPLPGIECGDIGPKIGYLTKDNGYLIINNVRIPRRYMLSKIIGLTRQGQLEVRGNPKIFYATMMLVRRYISCVWPKMYSQSISIACRYSMFRRQFRGDDKQEIPVIEYQTQQLKLIPLIAQYYAITIAGNQISTLTDQNFNKISQNNDDSLMAETHARLCYGKSYFSDVVMRGMDICRRACGGHGYSHYSGLPALLIEYTPNITHEGQNTVMYLQIARYLMKSYEGLAKKHPLQKSVQYLQSYDYLLKKKCSVSSSQGWTIEEIRLLLAQTVCSLISSIAQDQRANKEMSKTELNNKKLGLRLVDAAIAHCVYNTYYSFEQAIVNFTHQDLKKILFDLCMLYGINAILEKPGAVIQIGGIQPQQIRMLAERRQTLLSSLRPHIIGLVDGFGIPDGCLKSAIATGDNVYQVNRYIIQQLFDLARVSPMNTYNGQPKAVSIIKQGLPKPRL